MWRTLIPKFFHYAAHEYDYYNDICVQYHIHDFVLQFLSYMVPYAAEHDDSRSIPLGFADEGLRTAVSESEREAVLRQDNGAASAARELRESVVERSGYDLSRDCARIWVRSEDCGRAKVSGCAELTVFGTGSAKRDQTQQLRQDALCSDHHGRI